MACMKNFVMEIFLQLLNQSGELSNSMMSYPVMVVGPFKILRQASIFQCRTLPRLQGLYHLLFNKYCERVLTSAQFSFLTVSSSLQKTKQGWSHCIVSSNNLVHLIPFRRLRTCDSLQKQCITTGASYISKLLYIIYSK